MYFTNACADGSFERVLDKVLNKLKEEKGSKATLTVLENAVVTKNTAIPASLTIKLAKGAKLTITGYPFKLYFSILKNNGII